MTTIYLPGDVQRIQRLPDVLLPPEEELCEVKGRAAGVLSGPASTYQLQHLRHCIVIPLHGYHQHLHLANRYQHTMTVILRHNATDCCTAADDLSTVPPAPDVSYTEFETPLPMLRLRRSADSLEAIRYNQQGELKQCWHHHSKDVVGKIQNLSSQCVPGVCASCGGRYAVRLFTSFAAAHRCPDGAGTSWDRHELHGGRRPVLRGCVQRTTGERQELLRGLTGRQAVENSEFNKNTAKCDTGLVTQTVSNHIFFSPSPPGVPASSGPKF